MIAAEFLGDTAIEPVDSALTITTRAASAISRGSASATAAP